jgi:hypothetical protein
MIEWPIQALFWLEWDTPPQTVPTPDLPRDAIPNEICAKTTGIESYGK